MSWQNWIVSRVVCSQVRKPTKREPFDPVAIRLHTEKHKMLSSVELPPDWRIVSVDGVNSDGPIGEWIEPTDPDLHDGTSVVFYLHGGGHFFCNPCTRRLIAIGLAMYIRTWVYVPDYRLTSERPFPALVEDALFAYRTPMTQGVSPSHTVVTGNSTGGGLVLVLLVVLHDATDPLPAGAVLYSPRTDPAATDQSLINSDEFDAVPRGVWMARDAALYLGDLDAPADHPLASPLYADFTGLPTLHCYISISKALRDDTPRMAERARTAGISVSVEMGRQLSYIWPILYPFLPEARAAPKRSDEQIRRLVAVQHKNREPVELTPA